MKFEIAFNETGVTFVNTKTNKADKLAYCPEMGDDAALRAFLSENKARESGSVAAVNMLTRILDNTRFDGYKGQTPIGENIPKELKDAFREAEAEYMKPLFFAYHEAKGAKAPTIAKQWDIYIGAMRAGSSYAVAKGKVLALFAHLGQSPRCQTGKLLTVAAIDKILLNAKDSAGVSKKATIADKLHEMMQTIENFDGESWDGVAGDTATAIHALNYLVGFYEGLKREEQDAALRTYEAKTSGDVTGLAAAIVTKAKKTKTKTEEPALL